MKDHGVALSNLAKQAPFVRLNDEQEARVIELITEIRSIFDQQLQKAG